MGKTMGTIHEAFYQLWTFYHLLWYLLCIHCHYCRKLPTTHRTLLWLERRSENFYLTATYSIDFALMGAKLEISCAILKCCKRFYGCWIADNILLLYNRYASN